MLTTWIEEAASGRHGGPIRAGMWGAVVIGSHPSEPDRTEVWLELRIDDEPVGPLPGYWLEHRGVDSIWHAPIPPQANGARIQYRSVAIHEERGRAESPWRVVVVRPNLPDRTDPAEPAGHGLVGNRRMTVRVDHRGSTYDVFFPSVGLRSEVRPAEGDLPHSRSHFRTIVGGLAVGSRLDWFAERQSWRASQAYLERTNLLRTRLDWRRGPIRVEQTDLVVVGPELPRTEGGLEAPGQYLKRFEIANHSARDLQATFGLYIEAEINGGIGETNLGWLDSDGCLLAANRGHWHANRKLARNATVEFAVAMDGRGPVDCEPTGSNEAIMIRPLMIPAGGTARVDVLVSGAFTGWRGDNGTFVHWLRPALRWFRSADLDRIEQATRAAWQTFLEPLPELRLEPPRRPETRSPSLQDVVERSSLTIALHADADHGAIAAGFDRGLNAYCWPRDALWTSAALDRLGHPEISRGVFDWLGRTKGSTKKLRAWFMKYTIDGQPEWETPAIDQSALIPWAIERHLRRTGDLERVRGWWPIIERAARVCLEGDGHPGLRWLDDLALFSSAGLWETRFGAYLGSNAVVVAGLRAAARLCRRLNRPEGEALARDCERRAERILEVGILGQEAARGGPGLVDERSGRFLEGRRIGRRRALWSDRPADLVEASGALDIAALGLVEPFELLPASDPRMRKTATAMLKANPADGTLGDLTCWAPDPDRAADSAISPSETHREAPSSLATLWMARYLLRLGRETGEARHWSQALAMLQGVIDRLGPLGVNITGDGRRLTARPETASRSAQGVWGLHAMLVETALDVAGLDYDALDRRLTLRPVLPTDRPAVSLAQNLPCGHVAYELTRGAENKSFHLSIQGHLNQPVELSVEATCPGLKSLGPWSSKPEPSTPAFDAKTGQVRWSGRLPAGPLRASWGWGVAVDELTPAV